MAKLQDSWLSEQDEQVLKHAKYYTTVIFRGRAKYDRQEHSTRDQAESAALKRAAEAKKTCGIYAVDGRDFSAHIANAHP